MSKNVLPLTPTAVALGLAAIMAATRFHQIGSVLHLVDASLAVFFLGGLYLRRSLFFGLFLAEAALIDYVAITLAGTSDYCVTAAYVFLLPTYATMWWSGDWFARRYSFAWRNLAPLSVALVVSTLAAFMISSGSFYLFSDYFAEMSWQEYAARVAKYLPSYLASTFAYVAAAVSVHLFAQAGAGRAGA
jgi:hypothetical protein